ncbi:hypothetical protein [Curtobacterium sp. ISL-83]|uniref:hypothetical protein n=1 Tax=Curtobacterium sp. ISL-83 TaxID=2819145 RepID=UPI001BE8BDFA|nr:hypothetical protein [Curtobacterium sp. ISL-83]MBT2503006.1 hypothetical protein [Curtobacterium sp. ISL-83]
MSVTAAALRHAADYPTTTRRARVTTVRAEVRDGVVLRQLGEIHIYPDSRRIEIVVGIGATPDEWDACDAHRRLLPRWLASDSPSDWNEIRHLRTGERIWRVGLHVPAPDPFIELELQMLLDVSTEVNA